MSNSGPQHQDLDEPLPQDLNEVKAAVSECIKDKQQLALFDEADYKRLWRGGYQSKAILQYASSEMLSLTGLARALVRSLSRGK